MTDIPKGFHRFGNHGLIMINDPGRVKLPIEAPPGYEPVPEKNILFMPKLPPCNLREVRAIHERKCNCKLFHIVCHAKNVRTTRIECVRCKKGVDVNPRRW